MTKINLIVKTAFLLTSALFMSMMQGRGQGTFSPYILTCAASDSTRIDSPTGSGTDYKGHEDLDSAFLTGIVSRQSVAEKSPKIYSTTGIPVKKTYKGKVYVKKGKKFVF